MSHNYVLKHKFKSHSCPYCGIELDLDVVKLNNKTCVFYFDCPNNCSLTFDESYQQHTYSPTDFYYEEEEMK